MSVIEKNLEEAHAFLLSSYLAPPTPTANTASVTEKRSGGGQIRRQQTKHGPLIICSLYKMLLVAQVSRRATPVQASASTPSNVPVIISVR